MKKTTKLLSVLLAFVMALSCMTMMASAAEIKYKTVADLENLNAYSPNYTVTRLSTEERMYIVLDTLDNLLGGIPNSKMNYPVIGDIDYGSVNGILATIDNVAGLLNNGFVAIAAKIALGQIGDLSFKNWQKGYTRTTKTSEEILLNLTQNILGVQANINVIKKVLQTGSLNLGALNSLVAGLDLSAIGNIPKLVKGLVYPLLSRPDNGETERNTYVNATADLVPTVQSFVNGLFTKPMNWTSVRADSTGNITNQTLPLPTDDSTTRYFVISADKKSIEQFDYNFDAKTHKYSGKYELTKEFADDPTSTTYVYKIVDGDTGDQTLKWYKAEGVADAVTGNIQSSYWLPSVKEAMANGTLTLDLNGTDTALGLLYKFIPYVFNEMAPTVLNGSVKKLLAGLFDVEFEFIGKLGSTELADAISGVEGAGDFFTKAQEYYTWEYSDYKVINGTPYYRFQDDFYKGIIPENISTYYYMFDWDWHVGGDFMNKYLPGAEGAYDTVLKSLNNFVADVLDLALVDTITLKDGTVVNLTTSIGWQRGDNSKIVDNALRAARAIFNIVPTEIFDEFVSDPELSPYYDLMMNGETPQKALTGLLAAVIEMVMPQIILPTGAQLANVPFIALGALVVRELCTQLMPTYNFDAMIYSDYNTKTLVTKTADQWLDTILYMGVNLGMFYLRNIADVGEDDETNGYYDAMAKLHALPAATPDAMTFAADAAYIGSVPTWQYLVDWVIDWALSNEVEWSWKFNKIINVTGDVSLSSYQDPWAKLDSVLLTLLPLDKVLNAGTIPSGKTFTETILRTKLVNSIMNLDVPTLISIFDVAAIDNCILAKDHIINVVVDIVKNLINRIINKPAGVDLIPANITTVDGTNGILNQTNIISIVEILLKNISTAIKYSGDTSTNGGLLIPVLPILNFFLGWTTDPQKYAEPSLVFGLSNGYVLAEGSAAKTTLQVQNNSAGMLLKHKKGNEIVKDEPYKIQLISVTSDSDTITVTGDTTQLVEPYAKSTDINISVPYSKDKMVDITVTYKFIGKDGSEIGGTQVATSRFFMSNLTKEAIPTWGDDQKQGTFHLSNQMTTVRKEMPEYIITDNINDAEANGVNINSNFKNDVFCSAALLNTDTANPLSDMFQWVDTATYVHPNNKVDATLKAAGAGYIEAKTTKTMYLVKMNPDHTDPVSGTGYSMGQAKLSFLDAKRPKEDATQHQIGAQYLYYYDVNDLKAVYDEVAMYSKTGFDLSTTEAQTAWDNFMQALTDAARLVLGPKNKTTFATDFAVSNIEEKTTALTNAKEALEEFASSSSSSVADVTGLKAALAAVETIPGKDIDFEDHQLFEYFQYEKQRNEARKVISSFERPTAPEKFIPGENLSGAVIDKIISANVEKVALGITETVEKPSKEDMDAYHEANNNWTAPTTSQLAVDDLASKVTYYAQFMEASPRSKDLDYKAFLNKEIAAANAQGYKQADYSADSWNAYTDALANATAIAAKSGADYSEVFDAKYELMKAERDLMPAYASMKESGYLDQEIIPLIEHAKAIIDNYGSIYDVKAGITEADAFAQLVKALGVAYDVTVDGVKHEGILYDHSALTFQAYDRVASYKNKIVVDNAADKLRAAIENFESTAKLEAKDETTAVDQTVRFIQGIAPGSIANAEQLLARVTVTGGTAVTSASKAGNYGTGARVEIKNGDILLATYFVIIYGDVNGDGAVDAFDAIEVDVANCTAHYMGDVYDDAADVTGDGKIDANDYSALVAAVKCNSAISQNPNA